MVLKAAKKPVPTRVVGLDCSTNSMAYGVIDNGRLVGWGEIKFKGSSVFTRLAYGQRRVAAIRDSIDADLVAIEGAVYVQNKKTVILLAYAFGAIISAMSRDKTTVEEYSPIQWQNAIGNKALTKAEKEAIKKATPGKSDSWYSNANREFRKQRTMHWVEKRWGVKVPNDNISDAIALASFAAGVVDSDA